jgi:hypothetical protein
MAVSKQFVENFTNAVILTKIMRAQEAIEFAAGNFSELESALSSVWSDFRRELRSISEEAMRSSRAIKRELAQYPKTLAFGLEKGRLFKAASKAAIADAAHPAAATCLGAICIAELVLFVVFFAVRGTRSRWFLKTD